MIGSNLEVITPGTSFDLVSLDEVKAFFNITTTTDDARLQAMITFNSLVIADICDRVFAYEKVKEVLFDDEWDYSDSYGLNLNRYPVRDIESVLVAGSPVDDWTLDGEAGILRSTMAWANEVEVTYFGGYNLPDEAPRALSLATIDGIRQSYYYGARDPMIQSIMDNNVGSVRYFPPPGVSRTAGGGGSGGATMRPLSPQATALIFPYTRRALA